MSSTAATTLNDLLYNCDSAARAELVAEEDPSLYGAQYGVFAAGVVIFWVLFGCWHGVTKCTYWRKMPARHLYETRLQTCFRPVS